MKPSEEIAIALNYLRRDHSLFIRGHGAEIRITAKPGGTRFSIREGIAVSLTYQGGQFQLDHPGGRTVSGGFHFSAEPGTLALGRKLTEFRRYRGTLEVSPRGANMLVVNRLGLEEYLRGVVPAEMLSSARIEAQKAQAVAARTYTVKNFLRHENEGFNLCDSTHCQVYVGYDFERPLANYAVDLTRGKILVCNREPINALYHSTCGGRLKGVESSLRSAYPYLRTHADDLGHLRDLCRGSPYFNWRFQVPKTKLLDLLTKKFGLRPGEIHWLKMPFSTELGRVDQVVLGNADRIWTAPAGEVIQFLNRRFPGLPIKSSDVTLIETSHDYLFEGHGLGHGLGLCQYGASGAAEAGFNFRQILAHYFPGTALRDFEKGYHPSRVDKPIFAPGIEAEETPGMVSTPVTNLDRSPLEWWVCRPKYQLQRMLTPAEYVQFFQPLKPRVFPKKLPGGKSIF